MSLLNTSPAPAARSPGRRLLRHRLAVSGLLIVLTLGLAGAFARFLQLKDPLRQHPDGLDARGMPVAPCRRYPLGTDSLGRDVLSRVVYGTQISLSVGLVAMLTAVGIGFLVGITAGYRGRIVDAILMRITDVMLAIPALLLAIAFAGLMDGRVVHLHPFAPHWHFLDLRLERGLVSIFLVIGIVSWTGIARVVRSQVLTLKEREFVAAALAAGASHGRIIWRHIVPNVLPAIIVIATMTTAGTIALEAGLSYLGVGVPPPSPSWGGMISAGQPYLIVAPWQVLAPGVAVIAAVVGFNLLGQGLQDVLDPFHQQP